MATLSDSLVSSSARKLPVRTRPDLTAKRQRYHGRSYWVVKDPVGLNYFRFQDEEYAILKLLDGTRSLDEVKEQFEADFPPQKITLEELQQFLGMLHRSGLIVAGVPGQGHQLRKRRWEKRKRELISSFSNVLALRFKGIDPERLLNAMLPWVRWFYHPFTVILTMLFAASAAGLVLVNFDVFRGKLPNFHDFFSPSNVILLAITLGLTKIVHEFGHGLTCKYFGGECHEMGVMLLVLTPCLYCNVSDSWMLPNKWHRAAIGAAGMHVELFLASIATYVWWFSSPGLLHYLALNVMFISSVSTIMFNANPLLRYDGYYILADLVEIPNLRQKATMILNRKAGEWFLGLEPQEDPFLPERNQIFFALYSVAAVFYRWFILLSILMFLYKFFEPYGLWIVGYAIGAASLYGLIVQPIYQLGKFFWVPGRWDKVKKPRLAASLAALAALVAAFLFVPLPYTVVSTLEVRPRDAASVYVVVPGRLEQVLVKPRQRVTKNTPLARLSSPEVEQQVSELEGQAELYRSQLESLRHEGLSDREAATRAPQLEEALRTVEGELLEKRQDLARLELRAPADGIVLPPPLLEPKPDPDGQLSGWSGTPLMTRNLGAFLEPSVLFCQIATPTATPEGQKVVPGMEPVNMEAILVVDQSDIDFVKEKQTVEIKLDELPSTTFVGTIDEVARRQLKVSPKGLSAKAGGELATKTDPGTGVEQPLSTSYQARVHLDDPEGILRPGLRGLAKVHVAPQTLGRRTWRLISETFNFRL